MKAKELKGLTRYNSFLSAFSKTIIPNPWKKHSTYIYKNIAPSPHLLRNKHIVFCMDPLISSLPLDGSGPWSIPLRGMPSHIQALHSDGWTFSLFSNQHILAIMKDPRQAPLLLAKSLGKIEMISSFLGLSDSPHLVASAFSQAEDNCSLPSRTMWDHLCSVHPSLQEEEVPLTIMVDNVRSIPLYVKGFAESIGSNRVMGIYDFCQDPSLLHLKK